MEQNRLRVVRAERRISQLGLARETEIGATRVWKIENDFVEPTDDERARIASVLRVSEEEIWPDRAGAAAEGQGPALGGDTLTRALA